MSAAKHTPAPWAVGSADWSENGFARYELRGIKTVSAPDARLIAAAPELLAAVLLLKEQNQELRGALDEAIELGVDTMPVRKWSLVLAESLKGWKERDAAIAKAAGSTS